MRVLLIGPPGAGKGTQAARIAALWGLIHISTGNLLRDAMSTGSPLGMTVKAIVDRGDLVGDDVMIDVVGEAIDDHERFLLDGFPRTLPQADALDAILAERGRPLQVVIHLDVPDAVVEQRFTGRRTCPVCQRAYHVVANPAKRAGVCDDDGAGLITRADDSPDAVRHRIAVYHAQTDPLAERYRAAGLLTTIDGTLPIGEVAERIQSVMEAAR